MDEYVERGALLDAYDKAHKGPTGGARKLIEEAPAADVVPVVRCKDCKHYGWEQEPCHGRVERFCRLHKGLVVVYGDTFCSYGERRDSDG